MAPRWALFDAVPGLLALRPPPAGARHTRPAANRHKRTPVHSKRMSFATRAAVQAGPAGSPDAKTKGGKEDAKSPQGKGKKGKKGKNDKSKVGCSELKRWLKAYYKVTPNLLDPRGCSLWTPPLLRVMLEYPPPPPCLLMNIAVLRAGTESHWQERCCE